MIKLEKSEILIKIKTSVSEVMGVPESSITDDTNLIEDLGVSSIDIIDISFELEKSLGMQIDVADFFQVARLRSDMNYVQLTINEIADHLLNVVSGVE